MFSYKTKFSMAKALMTQNSPFYIQFFITNRCNLKCKMCNIVQVNKKLQEISLEQITEIADNLVKIGAGVVLLTGGEPFLRKDIPKIVDIFLTRGLNVRLQTAGLKTNEKLLLECFNAGARDISVSLDSLIPEKQDYINGVSGSWEKAMATISSISKIFTEKGSICGLGCVLSKFNYREVPSIIKFATDIGWYLSLVPVHIVKQEDGLSFRGRNHNFAFDSSDYPFLDHLLQQIFTLKEQGYNIFDSDTYLKSAFSFIKTQKPTWRHNNVCDSPNLYFIIKPDGCFGICCDHDFIEEVPVYSPNFPEIYMSESFRKKVKNISTTCSGCQYGSYPEMTLSVRDMYTTWERLKLAYQASKSNLKSLDMEEIIRLAEVHRDLDEVLKWRNNPLASKENQLEESTCIK